MRSKLGLATKAGVVVGLGLVLLAPACGGAVSPLSEPGADAGPDTGQRGDSSSGADSSPGPDSGSPDTGRSTDSSLPDTSVPDTGTDAGRVPTNHRPDDSQCMQPAPLGDCNGGGPPGTMCTQDSQCTDSTMGTNGRCVTDGPLPGCRCTYDTCTGDSQCAPGELCVCHGSPYSSSGNTCMRGGCRVDSDCGPHGYCSPSTSSNSCGGVAGYYCHTAADQCVNDSDCPGGFDVCEWSTASGSWVCQMQAFCG